ncbi:MAG: acyltransferase [Synergistes sp.]|nr:acyltransferase [Synergistes sp.]
MDANTRYLNYIDYGKCFCLFYVFMVHTGHSSLNNYVAFCMPFFFFITGWNYDPDKRSFREFAAVRFKLLIVPYWLLMIFYRILDRIRFGIFEIGFPLDLKGTISGMLYGSFSLPHIPFITEIMKNVPHNTINDSTTFISPSICHLWFLPAMFSASIVFALLAPKFKKEFSVPKFIVTVIALLCLSSVEIKFDALHQLPWGLGRGFYGAAAMLSGFCFRRFAGQEALDIKKHTLSFILFTAAYILTIVTHSNGASIIISNYGDHGAASLFISNIGGICGAIVLLMLMKLIDDMRGGRAIKLLCIFGRKTLWIYGLHFFFFFLIELVYFKFGGKFQPDIFYMDIIQNDGAYVIINLLQTAAAFLGGLCATNLLKRIRSARLW